MIVGLVQDLSLEAQATVFQFTQLIVEELVNHTRVENLRKGRQIVVLIRKEVCLQAHFNVRMIQHLLHNLGVAPDWNALVAVIEVVVVIGHADRQAANNEGWQFSGCLAPLLLGIALNQFLVDIAPY